MKVPKIVRLNLERDICLIEKTAQWLIKPLNIELFVLKLGRSTDIVKNVYECFYRDTYDRKSANQGEYA